MQSFCKITIAGEVHYLPQVAAYPRAELLYGKDADWNARKESRRQQRQRIALSYRAVQMPCSRAESRMVQRNVRLLGLDKENAVRDSGHKTSVAYLMQVRTVAEQRRAAKLKRAAARCRASTLPAPADAVKAA